MKSKSTSSILKQNFSKLVAAGIPPSRVNPDDFFYFLDHGYFLVSTEPWVTDEFDISNFEMNDLLFLYNFVLKHFEYSCSEIEYEARHRLYERIQYSKNPIPHDERAFFLTILKKRKIEELELALRLLEDEDLFGKDLVGVIEDIERLFIFKALQPEDFNLDSIAPLLKEHPKRFRIQTTYLNISKSRKRVFDSEFDSLLVSL